MSVGGGADRWRVRAGRGRHAHLEQRRGRGSWDAGRRARLEREEGGRRAWLEREEGGGTPAWSGAGGMMFHRTGGDGWRIETAI